MKKTDNGEEVFIDYFSEKGLPESLSRSVYENIYEGHVFKFPVKPEDDLYKIHGIADEELDDLIIEIAEANNYEVPKNTDYWGKPIVTVEDLIQFVDSFPRKKS